jgi:cytochrome c-type biogenesis protein CcmF
MIWANRPRYGGFLVHLGIILLLVGVTGSYAFKQSTEGDVAKGGSLAIGRYELVFDGLATTQTADKQVASATFTLEESGKILGTIRPVKEYYPANDQTWTHVALHSTLAGDVYVTLLDYAGDGSSVSIQAQVNPLVNWLWIGGAIMVLGGLIALWPRRPKGGRNGR